MPSASTPTRFSASSDTTLRRSRRCARAVSSDGTVTTSAPLPRAVLFDCDGVIADSEPLHLRLFQEVLAPLGIAVSPAEYADRYLGYDDRGVFTEVLRAHGRVPAPAV